MLFGLGAVLGSALAALLVGLSMLRRLRLAEGTFAAVPRPRQVVTPKGSVIFSNRACHSFFGDDKRPIPEMLLERAALDEDAPRTVEALLEGVAERGSAEAEIRIRAAEADRGEIWCHVSAYALPRRRGDVLWVVDDITLRRQMEEVARVEQQRFLDLLEASPVGFYSVDEEGRFLFANQALTDWLGRSRAELSGGGLRLHDVVASRLLPDTPPYQPYPVPGPRGEAELLDAEAKAFRVLITQEVVEDGPDGALRTRSVVRHLSREQAFADALALSERRFQRFFDEAPVGIVQLDARGTVTDCNPAFRQMVEGAATPIVGRSLLDFVVKGDRPAIERLFHDAAARGARALRPVEAKLSADRDVICSLTLRNMESAEGKAGGFIAYLLDATEQRALELQFAQSQKMQAVGQLAGGIAHDFNNLLTAMIGFSDLLLLRHRPGDQSFADIMQIKQNANRAANLVRQLLAFSRQQSLQPRVLNVTDILAELSHLLRRLIGEAIELTVLHERDLGPVKADQGQLEQVIINLAVNARDAMPVGGKLVIRTANRSFRELRHVAGELVPAGDYVLLEVSDTGCGISKEHLGRIFDPFFSTKEVGEGTGLGLSTVYGIVKQTGGFISVDSQPGRGTTFSIYLPRFAESAPQMAQESDARLNRDLTGAGTLLLVEDEDAVRAFSARALRNKGYNVLEARSGEAALELLEGKENGNVAGTLPIDLLITDVVMPKLDGPALVKQVRERHPELKVIFISGYAEDSFRKRLGEEGDIHFLPKPFSLKQLAGKVKEVLGETRV